MSWDLFLTKILLKKEICGSREQCTGATGTQLTLFKKKKKKGETLDVDADAISKWILSMRLDLDENYKLFYYSAYFCYYS